MVSENQICVWVGDCYTLTSHTFSQHNQLCLMAHKIKQIIISVCDNPGYNKVNTVNEHAQLYTDKNSGQNKSMINMRFVSLI